MGRVQPDGVGQSAPTGITTAAGGGDDEDRHDDPGPLRRVRGAEDPRAEQGRDHPRADDDPKGADIAPAVRAMPGGGPGWLP